MAATTNRGREHRADLDLDLELALRGFLRADRGSGSVAWRRDVTPCVDVTVEGAAVQLACAGVGTACVEDRRDKAEVLRILDDWLSRHTPEAAGPNAAADGSVDEPVVATLLDISEAAPVEPAPHGTDSALPVRAGEVTMAIPGELWRLLSDQFDQVRELGDQLAVARERAARAETEAAHLRSRLDELDVGRPRAVSAVAATGMVGSGAAPGVAVGFWRRLLERRR